MLLGFLAACGDNKVESGVGPIECNAPEQLCGTTCIDVTESEANCGSCNNACSNSEICLGGACVTKAECDGTQTDCNNVCTETQTDEENCGTCGNKCTAGQVCIDGACEATVTCTPPQVNCNNDCVDTTDDEQNCGSCGNACGANQTCTAGSCQATVTCTLPQVACNNVCIDPTTDEANCGGCDMPCTNGQTCTPTGNTGVCQTTTVCSAPQLNCDNTCVDPRDDEDNCGGCGNECQPGQTCTPNGNTGTCEGTVTCTPPETDCNNMCVNTQTDANNCGSCGNPCGGSTPDCCGGTCKDFDTDEQNCGSCGNICASDQTCNSGTCTDICAAGLEFCNGQCVDTQTSNTDCGGCGDACSPPTTTCQAGSCTPTCPAPNMQCGPNCIDTTNNNANCGACNNACTGGKVCSNSACACPAGTMDCNGTCIDTQSDEANCGACGNPCASGLTCVTGTCTLVCPSGQTNCNGTCVDTNSDEAHCGNCTTTCDAGNFEQCIGGLCDVTCSGSLPDECEGTCIDFDNGTQNGGVTENCGGCGPGFDCPMGQACSNGSCVLSCGSGTTLCSGACVDFMTDEQNCGGCGPGFECPANSTCNNGSCGCDPATPDACPGVCVDFDTDEGHCGNCTTSCSGTQTCDDGICCGVGTENCNGQCVPTNTPQNCGGCGITCDPGEVCNGGQCECPFGQAVCPNDPGGGCQVTSNNPDACGPNCEICSGATPFCVANGCAAACPAPLTACDDDCVNVKADNANCGTCGNPCGPGLGCSDGQCVPAIPVGPDPAKCVNGGPPITVPTEDGDTCTGSLGAVTFRFGLCSCTNIGPLTHDLTVDAFDSRFGPYDPTNTAKRMGGGIGVNRTMQSTATTEAFGEIWVFGNNGTVAHATKGPLISHSDFYNKGNFAFTSLVSVDEPVLGKCSVDTDQKCLDIGNACPGTAGTCMAAGEDAYFGGTIDKSSGGGFGMTVSGDLESALTTCSILVGEDVIPNAMVRPQDCHNPAPFDPALDNPCDCTVSSDPNENQIIPVRSIVAHFANPANNDNALLTPDLDPNVLVNPTGAQRLDLPCGNYYLNQINTSNATTIVVHGRTGLYIGGSIIVSQQIIFELDPDATLDIFVGGVMKTSNTVTVGNPAYPRLSRMYFGSAGCSGSGDCAQNADCCSGVCQANGKCLGGAGGNISEAVGLSGTSFLNGLFYAGVGTIRVTNPLNMNGAIFANYYDSVQANIHYDKGAVANGAECPPPDECDSCQDCNNQACVDGQCGQCTDSSQCCSPLQCVNGTCVPLGQNN